MRLIDPPGGRPWALLGLCGASVLLNLVLAVMLFTGSDSDPVEEPVVQPEAVVEPAVAAVAPVAVAIEPVASLEDPVWKEPLPAGVDVLHANVRHSLARTFQESAGSNADMLSAVYARLFFWELDLRRDLQKGDRVALAWTWDNELADIQVATYESKKLSRTLRAYQYQATGDTFRSWWDADGKEVASRLKTGPLKQYQQITSLLKDRPTHRGMDFKTPEGTDVISPLKGKVTRTNWNTTYNGNCVEIRYKDGTLARFLHLSETAVKPGQNVGVGKRIGASGNTGRSTAPHLHYELERNGGVVDPVQYHGLTRRSIPDADRAGFEAERERLDAMLVDAA